MRIRFRFLREETLSANRPEALQDNRIYMWKFNYKVEWNNNEETGTPAYFI